VPSCWWIRHGSRGGGVKPDVCLKRKREKKNVKKKRRQKERKNERKKEGRKEGRERKRAAMNSNALNGHRFFLSFSNDDDAGAEAAPNGGRPSPTLPNLIAG